MLSQLPSDVLPSDVAWKEWFVHGDTLESFLMAICALNVLTMSARAIKQKPKLNGSIFFIISYTLVISGSIYFTNSSADISVWLLRVFGLSLFEILIYFAIISTAIPLLLLLLALRLPGLLIVLLIYSYYNFYCSNIYSHCFCYSYF